jgi:hypothetical protein
MNKPFLSIYTKFCIKNMENTDIREILRMSAPSEQCYAPPNGGAHQVNYHLHHY